MAACRFHPLVRLTYTRIRIDFNSDPCVCMVLSQRNSACVAGGPMHPRSQCVGGVLLVQWCCKHVLELSHGASSTAGKDGGKAVDGSGRLRKDGERAVDGGGRGKRRCKTVKGHEKAVEERRWKGQLLSKP